CPHPATASDVASPDPASRVPVAGTRPSVSHLEIKVDKYIRPILVFLNAHRNQFCTVHLSNECHTFWTNMWMLIALVNEIIDEFIERHLVPRWSRQALLTLRAAATFRPDWPLPAVRALLHRQPPCLVMSRLGAGLHLGNPPTAIPAESSAFRVDLSGLPDTGIPRDGQWKGFHNLASGKPQHVAGAFIKEDIDILKAEAVQSILAVDAVRTLGAILPVLAIPASCSRCPRHSRLAISRYRDQRQHSLDDGVHVCVLAISACWPSLSGSSVKPMQPLWANFSRWTRLPILPVFHRLQPPLKVCNPIEQRGHQVFNHRSQSGSERIDFSGNHSGRSKAFRSADSK